MSTNVALNQAIPLKTTFPPPEGKYIWPVVYCLAQTSTGLSTFTQGFTLVGENAQFGPMRPSVNATVNRFLIPSQGGVLQISQLASVRISLETIPSTQIAYLWIPSISRLIDLVSAFENVTVIETVPNNARVVINAALNLDISANAEVDIIFDLATGSATDVNTVATFTFQNFPVTEFFNSTVYTIGL